MTPERNAPRLPWIALTLSLLSSGVGHIYCGRIVKGLFLYMTRLVLPVLCIIAAFAPPTDTVFYTMLLLPAAGTAAVFFYSAVDSCVVAKRAPADYVVKEYNRAGLYVMLISVQLGLLFVVALGSRAYFYEAYVIPTRSMSPNFLAGDRILVNKQISRTRFPGRGDVVVFRTPESEQGQTWIKRVIGLAGDEIKIHGRKIEINGEALKLEELPGDRSLDFDKGLKGEVWHESLASQQYTILYSNDIDEAEMPEEYVLTVPEQSIFVLGDNRNRSRDSRHVGTIPIQNIIGSVDYIYWPANAWSRGGAYQDR